MISSNLAERSFVEERRRTKVIGRFGDERSAMKLVYAVMIRAAERWCRVSGQIDPCTGVVEPLADGVPGRRRVVPVTR